MGRKGREPHTERTPEIGLLYVVCGRLSRTEKKEKLVRKQWRRFEEKNSMKLKKHRWVLLRLQEAVDRKWSINGPQKAFTWKKHPFGLQCISPLMICM